MNNSPKVCFRPIICCSLDRLYHAELNGGILTEIRLAENEIWAGFRSDRHLIVLPTIGRRLCRRLAEDVDIETTGNFTAIT